MEFQIAEAIELIKTLAETENLTHTQALRAFVTEAGMDLEDASILKAALFEEYTLQEMASDTLTKALHTVFVLGESTEDLQEVDTKETQEGTKYKIRVKDRQSGSSYVRYATREKVAELRANPNIASVEMTDHGTTGEDDKGERTAAAKTGRDYDGDGKKESSSKEHAGVVHNAIQKRMGGKPDGQDTRKEEFASEAMQHRDAKTGEVTDKAEIGKTYYPHGERQKSSVALRKEKEAAAKKKKVEEAMDFKGARREDDRRKKVQDEKDKKSPSSKDARLALGKFRPGASNAERAEGGRDVMREKGTSPTKKGKKMFEAYLEYRAAKLAERFEVTDADERGNTEAYKRYKAGNPAYKRAESKKKVETKEEWKPDPVEKREKKAAKLGREEEIESGKSKKYGRDDAKIDKLYKRRQSVQFKKKMSEDLVVEADLVDAGRENQGERDKKKLTGKGVDNSASVKLMPKMQEAVVTSSSSKSISKLSEGGVNTALRAQIKEMRAQMKEECCPKCGTPECTCEGKKEDKKDKKKVKIDEAGMPITETKAESRNNARPGPSEEMKNPPADPLGPPGHMNPKGEPKRYKEPGEAPGDRRPNRKKDKSLPFEDGTVPNGSGV